MDKLLLKKIRSIHKQNGLASFLLRIEKLVLTAKTGAAMTWPSERYAYVKFGYDNTLKNQLASVGKSFNTWVDSVMTHVQAHYRHSSLPTKIQFKYDKSETIY